MVCQVQGITLAVVARAAAAGAERFRYLDHDGPIAFAHRGGAAESFENTRGAFSHAYRLGYRYMETDIRATADGVAVLFHDPDLARLAGRPERIEDVSWGVLQEVRLGGDQRVLRLEEALDAWPEVRWNLDPKADSAVAGLVEAVRRTGSIDRVCVTSFSERRLHWVRRALGPRLCMAMGPAGVGLLRAMSLAPSTSVLRAVFGRYGAAQIPERWGRVPLVDERFVTAAHRAALAVHVWTINSEPEMRRLLGLGVDGLMTDVPTVLRSVLIDRGEWHDGSASTRPAGA